MDRRPTLADLVPAYLRDVEGENAPSTVRRKRGILERMKRELGDVPVAAIRREHVERYRRDRRREVSGASVNRELATLSHLMAWARRLGYRDDNPVRGIPRYPENADAWRRLTPREAERLLAACRIEEKKAPHLYPMVLTALLTGLRKGELLGLRWSDLDLDDGTDDATLEVRRHKNRERSRLPLPPRLARTLRRLPRRGEHVFTHADGRPLGNVRRSFATALRRAGLPRIRWHDLRHTFASWLVESGADLFTVQELMGHRNLSMTRRYAHLSMRHKREAVGRIGLGR